MESFFGRYKNPLVLMVVLLIQVIALATQVKRPLDPKVPNSPAIRLIRVWTVTAFTPLERALIGSGRFVRHGWSSYIDLHTVSKENQDLQAEITRMRIEEAQLKDDAEQAHRLQTLLGFRETFIGQTVPAQVIGTSGSEQSHVLYIDKGSRAGIKTDMAVITPDGIVGKVREVMPFSSQVLMIDDRDSGAGVLLEKSRLQGILRGALTGELQVDGIMADQTVETGEKLVASGGDRIYPKGFPVGTVIGTAPDRDTGTFLVIKVKPSADLNRLEEVLVVTQVAEREPTVAEGEGPLRAADILAERLPSVPKDAQPPVVVEDAPGGGTAKPKSATSATEGKKPAVAADKNVQTVAGQPAQKNPGGKPADSGTSSIHNKNPEATIPGKKPSAPSTGPKPQQDAPKKAAPKPDTTEPAVQPAEKPPQ